MVSTFTKAKNVTIIGTQNIIETKTESTIDVALKDREGWLREWEKAQWQDHLHNQSNNNPDQLASQDIDEKIDSQVTSKRSDNSYERATYHEVKLESPERLEANKYLPSVSDPAFGASSARYDGVRANVIGITTRDSGQPIPQAEMYEMSLMAVLNWSTAKIIWQRRMMYALRSGKKLRVWIRDADLNLTVGTSILNALRSELVGFGFELASLTINGQNIWQLVAETEQRTEQQQESNSLLNVDHTY